MNTEQTSKKYFWYVKAVLKSFLNNLKIFVSFILFIRMKL